MPVKRSALGVRVTALTVVAAAVTAAVLWAGVASASYAQCLTGQSCVWALPDGGDWVPVVEASSTHSVGVCYNFDLAPQGGFHSAKGDYGSPYGFQIYLLRGCSGISYLLTNGATKSFTVNSGFKIQSFKKVSL